MAECSFAITFFLETELPQTSTSDIKPSRIMQHSRQPNYIRKRLVVKCFKDGNVARTSER